MSATEFTDTVRAVAGDLAAEVADARRLRVLCPRGHFIVNLAVIRLRDGLVVACALDGLDATGFADELAEIVAAAPLRPPRGTPGMVKQSGDRIGVYNRADVSLDCPHRTCTYRGSFEFYSFAAELGAAAERHTEHRLTN